MNVGEQWRHSIFGTVFIKEIIVIKGVTCYKCVKLDDGKVVLAIGDQRFERKVY